MTHQFTLQFDTEDQAIAALDTLTALPRSPETGKPELPESLVFIGADGAPSGQGIVIKGVQGPGTYNAEGKELTPPVPVAGVFVNLILAAGLPSELLPFRVPYGSAGLVWGGTEPEPGAWPPKAA